MCGMMAVLELQDGTKFFGESFGAAVDEEVGPSATLGTGEVVFTTGMVGYPESLTDPSYHGQILVFTYPLIGNYGVPSEECNEWGFSNNFESERIWVSGVVVAQVSEEFSHHRAVSSLHQWLEHHGVPGITGVDTRALTKKLREHGVMLGRIRKDALCHGEPVESMAHGTSPVRQAQGDVSFEDPNQRNLVAEVSCKEVMVYDPTGAPLPGPLPRGEGKRAEAYAQSSRPLTVVAYDCGMKRNILRSFLKRGVRVVRVPWNFNVSSYDEQYDGVFISNGPGDPKMCQETIRQIQWCIEQNIPTFGICLGNQLMALAIGGDTYKLKYGHRGANQPCILEDSKVTKESKETEESTVSTSYQLPATSSARCIITSQNHGYAVSEDLPQGWSVWFRNANDGTVEGIRHESGKFFAVQFHPEASPGPEDANYLFDEFLNVLHGERALTPSPPFGHEGLMASNG